MCRDRISGRGKGPDAYIGLFAASSRCSTADRMRTRACGRGAHTPHDFSASAHCRTLSNQSSRSHLSCPIVRKGKMISFWRCRGWRVETKKMAEGGDGEGWCLGIRPHSQPIPIPIPTPTSLRRSSKIHTTPAVAVSSKRQRATCEWCKKNS
jgi:hypothetical protein